MSQITIECKKITKQFGQKESLTHVLKGIDLVVYENETIMLMGPSGSGKTTLISIIGGLLQQTAGECLVLGRQINSLSESEKTKFRGQNIGFLFQYFNLVPTLNAVENTAIPLLLNGTSRKEAFEKATKILQEVELESRIYNVPQDLSGGEQQRVALARACIHRPKLILCDEPTSFLDMERGLRIMELMKKIKQETGCTLIIVTHDPRILSYADRIIEIDDGILKKQKESESQEPCK